MHNLYTDLSLIIDCMFVSDQFVESDCDPCPATLNVPGSGLENPLR